MTTKPRQPPRASSRRLRLCVTALVVSCLLLPACGRRHYKAYHQLIAANRLHVESLEPGMDRRQVEQVMADGKSVSYGKLQVTNPYRSDGFTLEDGTRVRILFYLTEAERKYGRATKEELTPVVLENGKLVGWGWSFLERHVDRYGIKPPQ